MFLKTKKRGLKVLVGVKGTKVRRWEYEIESGPSRWQGAYLKYFLCFTEIYMYSFKFMRGSKVVGGWDPGLTSRRKARVKVRIRFVGEKVIKWKHCLMLTMERRHVHRQLLNSKHEWKVKLSERFSEKNK